MWVWKMIYVVLDTINYDYDDDDDDDDDDELLLLVNCRILPSNTKLLSF